MIFGDSHATQTLNLDKGQVLDLAKAEKPLRNVIIGAGWDANINGNVADLDLSAFLLDNNRKVTDLSKQAVFYNQQQQQGIYSSGDNRTGEGDGDDEQIVVDLDAISPNISELVFIMTIDKAAERRQTFGQIKNAYVRLLDADDNDREVLNFNLSEDYGTSTAMIACSLRRTTHGWEFKAVGDSLVGTLNDVLAKFQ